MGCGIGGSEILSGIGLGGAAPAAAVPGLAVGTLAPTFAGATNPGVIGAMNPSFFGGMGGGAALGGTALLAGGITAGMAALFAFAAMSSMHSMTPEEARASIDADIEYLARLQPLIEAGGMSWDIYGDSLTAVVDNMTDLADRAGTPKSSLRRW
jgi:hypothetical protein